MVASVFCLQYAQLVKATPTPHPHSLINQMSRSTTDDPAVLSAMMPWWHFASEPQHQRVRWTMCAREICFKNDLLRWTCRPAISTLLLPRFELIIE